MSKLHAPHPNYVRSSAKAYTIDYQYVSCSFRIMWTDGTVRRGLATGGFLFEVAVSICSNLKTPFLPWSQQHWRHPDKFPDQSFQRSDPNQISALQGHLLPGCCAGSTKPRRLPTHTRGLMVKCVWNVITLEKLPLHIIALGHSTYTFLA